MYWTLKRMISWGVKILIIGIMVGYAYFQSRAILAGPSITIETPENGITATSSFLSVSGTVKHAKEITLQGRPIFIDTEGRFTEKLLLMEGYNIIELTAKDAGGRETKKRLELVYVGSTTPATTHPSTASSSSLATSTDTLLNN